MNLSGNLTNLKSIGADAFANIYGTGKLVMPSVETISPCAFYYTRGGITFDFENAPLSQIDSSVFCGSDHHCFKINTKNIVKIGSANAPLGMLITDVSDFSPLLTTIPYKLNPQVNALPDTVTVIKSCAFTEEKTDFRLSKYLKEIAVDAFPKGSTFIVDAGSYAELWCSENGFGYSIEGQQDDLSWLN